MAQQTIGIGSTANDGTGDTLRDAFDKANDNFTELYDAAPVALESFAGANDTAKLVNALASGERIVANAAAYSIDPTQLPAVTVPAFIEFGRNTVINSLQTSGTKLPILRFAGAGLQGSPTVVTAIDTAHWKNSVTVTSVAGLAVGDTVLLQEIAPLQTETQFAGAATQQDFNYREYLTIEAIVGNEVTFEESIRFPFSLTPFATANGLTLQKVAFLENVHVSGGIFTGSNATGGGVQFDYCRYSSVEKLRCYGLSEVDKNGGSPINFNHSWACSAREIIAEHTLFVMYCVKNQGCQYSEIFGKRTANGGIIASGERMGLFDRVTLDAPGDTDGDCFGLHNGARKNRLSNFVCYGSQCYTSWIHQSCDENEVDVFSYAGITATIQCASDRNRFRITSKDHGGSGVYDLGQDNYYEVDITNSGGHAVLLGGHRATVRGRAETGATGSFYDVVVGSACTGSDVQTYSTTSKGVLNSSPTSSGNVVQHQSLAPFSNNRAIRSRGWSWAQVITGVNVTPKNVPLINDQNVIVDWVSRQSGDQADVYRVTLALNSTIADTISEYLIVDRQSGLTIKKLYEGTGTFVPKLSLSSGNVQVAIGSASLTVLMMVEKF